MDEQKQDKILTIPNLMSLFRIVLIPFILLTYGNEMRMISLLLLALSWLTDILDGQIARRFHMISSLGKALDPVADKLTQGCLLLVLISDYPAMLAALIVFLIVQAFMLAYGALVIKKTGTTFGAGWHGKIATGVLDAVVIIHVAWAGIPAAVSAVTIAVCIGTMAVSVAIYIVQYRKWSKNQRLEVRTDVSQS